jgi:hypothetical protein
VTGPDSGAVDGTRPPFQPGANVLVVGEADSEALPFALSRMDEIDKRLLISTDVPAKQAVAMATEGRVDSPLTVVDCTGETEPVPAVDGRVDTAVTVTVTDPDIASVGEAAVEALDRLDPPITAGICVDSVSTLVARSTVQQTYKLLYVLAGRVQQGNHLGVYNANTPAEPRTLRILGQALDYRVSLSGEEEPTVRSLAGVGDDR